MEKNNKCTCIPAVWLEWENQMEPEYWCPSCQLEWHEATSSPADKEEVDDLPF